jgi:hypothetical protein
LRPENWAGNYNLACLEAVEGNTDAALQASTLAVAQGGDLTTLIARDGDWRDSQNSAAVK